MHLSHQVTEIAIIIDKTQTIFLAEKNILVSELGLDGACCAENQSTTAVIVECREGDATVMCDATESSAVDEWDSRDLLRKLLRAVLEGAARALLALNTETFSNKNTILVPVPESLATDFPLSCSHIKL